MAATPRGGQRWGRLAALVAVLALAHLGDANAAAINVRGAAAADNGAGGTSLTITRPGGVVAGDLMLAQVTIKTGGSSASVTAPAGWTQIVITTSGSGAGQVAQRVYRRKATATEPASYVWSWSGLRVASGGMVAYLGANTNGNPIAATASATGNCASGPCTATVPASGTMNTGGAQNWVVGLFGVGSTSTWTAPAALPPLYGAAASGGAASTQAAAVAGSTSVSGQSADATGAGQWVGHLVAVELDTGLPSATLTNPGTTLRGTVALSGTASDSASGVASVSFEYSPAGAGTWTAISVDTTSPYGASFDTTALADGVYDLRTTALDWAGNVGTSTVRANRTIDNTAPVVALADPGAALRGTVGLTAAASDTGGSGIASVAFAYSPADAGTWTLIRTDATSPYTASFDTSLLPEGSYDIRALATDVAGNTRASIVAGRLVDNSLPSVSLDDPGTAVGGTVTLTAAAFDPGSGVASVAFEISPAGAGTWTAVAILATAPFEADLDTTALADGLYDLRAVATNGAGGTAASVVAGRMIDNTVPAASLADPGALLIGTVALEATATDDLAGVASVSFEVSPAGAGVWTAIATDTTDPYSAGLDTTALGDGLYDLRVVATDAAGNTQGSSVPARLVDNGPPSLALDDPGAALRGSVTLTAQASDGASGVASVAFEVSPAGEEAWSAIGTDPDAPYSASLDPSGLGDGTYDFRAVATDAAGHATLSVVTSRIVDNTAPAVTLADPGALLTGMAPLAATASDDLAGVASVSFEVSPAGADTWTAIAADMSDPYAASLDTSTFGDGAYDLRAVATDAAGNTQSSVVTGRLVDNAGPSVTLIDPGAFLAGTVTLEAIASDDLAGITSVAFEYSPAGADTWTPVDTDTAAPYTASLDTTALADGVYDLRAVATDAAGHATVSTAAGRAVDNTASDGAVTSPDLFLRGMVTLTAAAADAGSGVASVTFEYSPAGADAWTAIAIDTTEPYEAAFDTTAVPDGTYDLRVVVRDVGGNTTSSITADRLVDNTAPESSATVPRGVGSQAVTVRFTGTDAGSGVAGFEHSVDGDPFEPGRAVTIEAPGDGSNDGSHTIAYRAVDRAGNVETAKTVTVLIDAAGGSASADSGAVGAADSTGSEADSASQTVEVTTPAVAPAFRVFAPRLLERRGRVYLSLKLSASEPVVLRGEIRSRSGERLGRFHRRVPAGVHRIKIRLHLKEPYRGRCTLVVKATAIGLEPLTLRASLRLPG